MFALITLAPLMFPPVPAPVMMLPVIFAVPATFIPVPVTMTTLALPTALKLMLPFATGMLTLLLPLNIVLLLVDIPVN